MTDRARLTVEQVEDLRAVIKTPWPGCTSTPERDAIMDALCDTALRSLERPACRVVPEEPTEEMINALLEGSLSAVKMARAYKAMLAAAPPAKQPSGGEK